MSGPLKRSPGPWVVTHRHVDGTVHDDEIDGLGLEIEAIERPLIRGGYARAGDAHLIAAAPDLLEALKALVRVNEDHNAAMGLVIKQPVTWKDTYLDAARTAIARAEGREP